MAIYFGTDGIRGIVNLDLTADLAIKCGNSLTQEKQAPKVLIGWDTRVSCTYLANAFACGVMAGGGSVSYVGIIPTAGIAYLTKTLKYDYGVMISASHNPKEYNGIKIFDACGFKLGDLREMQLERHFCRTNIVNSCDVGSANWQENFKKYYQKYLFSLCDNFKDLKIVIDGSNGASFKIAPNVFRLAGAQVFAINCHNDGLKINDNCGSLHIEKLQKSVKKFKADIGFAFDGDADRIIAVDKTGKVIDGDMILFLLAWYFKLKGEKLDKIVGTSHTNLGIEKSLNEMGIELLRADIGDKYVLALMQEKNVQLGGEQSGHIIIGNLATTGDGIIASIMLCNLLVRQKEKFYNLLNIYLYEQVNINVKVADKLKVLNSEELNKLVGEIRRNIYPFGRVFVRASGTEPVIRIMVEHKEKEIALEMANKIKIAVENLI